MRSIVLAAPVAALALCACTATGPKFAPLSPPEGKAVVYVYRMNHFAMSMSDVHIYLDGKKVFDLTNDGYSTLTLAPGHYVISERLPDGLDGKTDLQKPVFLPLDVKAGQRRYVHFEIRNGDADTVAAANANDNVYVFDWWLHEEDEATGLRELADKHFQAPF